MSYLHISADPIFFLFLNFCRRAVSSVIFASLKSPHYAIVLIVYFILGKTEKESIVLRYNRRQKNPTTTIGQDEVLAPGALVSTGRPI